MIRSLLIINFLPVPNFSLLTHFFRVPNFFPSTQFFTYNPIYNKIYILIKHDSFISSILYYDKFYIMINFIL